MYFEKHHSFVNRHGWTYNHTGEQLRPLAETLHERYARLELEARNLVGDLLKNPTVHHDDRRVREGRDQIKKYGQLREQCAVWAHEFGRDPSREFPLGISDVSFFCVFGGAWLECLVGATKRNDWKFAYPGEELINPLRTKCEALRLTLNNVKEDSDEWAEAQQELLECSLLIEEFSKNPYKEVLLGLGDVVYLSLAPLLNLEQR